MGQYETQWGKTGSYRVKKNVRCYNRLWLGINRSHIPVVFKFHGETERRLGKKSKNARWQGSDNKNKVEKH